MKINFSDTLFTNIEIQSILQALQLAGQYIEYMKVAAPSSHEAINAGSRPTIENQVTEATEILAREIMKSERRAQM